MRRGWSRMVAPAAALLLMIGLLPGQVLAAPSAAGHDREQGNHQSFRTVGYFIQWGIYGRSFFVKNLATSGTAAKLTHVNYAFANVGEDGRCFEANLAGQGDAWADYQRPVGAEESVDGVADAPEQALKGNFNQLRKLKARNPDLRTMISLGGWTWSKWFSDAALTKASREAFVASCIDLFIKGDLPRLGSVEGGPGSGANVFDGIDLDWEWPGSEGNVGNVIRPEDKGNFTKLAAEFRRQLDAYGRRVHKHYELSAFLPAAPAKMDAGFEGRQIFNYLDFATVQGYDFHGTWEATTNHQSALFEPRGQTVLPDFTADAAIEAWIACGAPRGKLVLGLPFYGRGWAGVGAANAGLFQQSTGAAPGTWEAGVEDYKVLKTRVGAGFTVHRDLSAGFAWLFDGSTFWTFDDPVVMRQKADYIKQHDLGGAMVWSLDADTENGELITAIHDGLR